MSSIIKKPSAWLPIAVSLVALAMMLGYIAKFGVVYHADEGTPAHLFQIFVAAEVFAISFFAIKWLPRAPKPALVVLVLQVVALLLPMSVVFYLKL